MALQDSFEFPVAYNPTTDELVTGAEFLVYAVDDIAFATPLAVTDPTSGVAISPLVSSSIGVLPSFSVAGNPSQVIVKSGTFVTLLTSKYGIFLDVVPDPSQILAAIDAAAAASYARDEAVAAASSASDNYVSLVAAAKNPDLLVAGAIAVDGNDLVTSAAVVWPNGEPGTLTITSRDANGAVLGYNITYGSPVTRTYTQPTITRNANGAATNVPQIVVT